MICHSVAVVLTLVQKKQIGINIHKRNNTKNKVQTIQNTVNTFHILPKHPHITISMLTHIQTLQNKLKTTTVQEIH